MKKVTNTKDLTVSQLRNMTKNLKEKFGKFSAVGGEYLVHDSREEMKYSIYVADRSVTKTFDSWTELLQYYYELMKVPSDG